MNQPGPKSPAPRRWSVFGIISLVYLFVYFHRVSTSVIAQDLLIAFDTNATALGLMASMYNYLYALEQPLVGLFTDRLGPGRVIGFWSLAAAAGCFVFALAPDIFWASTGRALIGLGVGGVYVPALKAISQWFKKSEFSTLVGILMSVGNLGAMIATTPLAWMAVAWGWRPTFFAIGTATVLLSGATLWITRSSDHAPGAPADPPPDGAKEPHGSARIIGALSSARFWIVAAIFFGIYGTLVTFQGLWATPFLMAAFKVEKILASKINMLIPLGVVLGAPVFGRFSDRFSRDKVLTLIGIIGLYAVTWTGLIWLFDWLGMAGTAVVLFAMGVATGGFISTLWGIVRETTPARFLGLTSGLLNGAPFLGIAAFQVITGAILDRAGIVDNAYTLAGFHQAFGVCLAGIVLCLGLATRLRQR